MRKYKTPTRRHRTSMFCFSFQLTFISCKRIKKRKLIKKNLTFPTICLQAYNFFAGVPNSLLTCHASYALWHVRFLAFSFTFCFSSMTKSEQCHAEKKRNSFLTISSASGTDVS